MQIRKYNKKEHPLLKFQMEEKEWGTMFNFINRKKGIDAIHKLLLNEMCNDIYMNGQITWKHSTYADHLGIDRRQILRHFNKYEELGILVPDSTNKRGSKGNVFYLNFSKVDLLGQKHVTPKVAKKDQTCDTEGQNMCHQGSEHVTLKVETCDTGVTYTNNYRHDTNMSTVELAESSSKDDSTVRPKKEPTETDIELLAQEIDI